MNYRKDLLNEIDKNIVSAYQKKVNAENKYYEAIKKHKPECLFKEGEYIFYKRNSSNRKYCGMIKSISYDPYRWASYFGWYITIKPLNKGFKNSEKIKASLHPKDYSEIIKR